MAIEAKVLADSVAPCGKRLTTYLGRYWRGIHAEVLTHKALSRNSASSRAIPVDKMLEQIVRDPFVPLYIGANQKGMQAGQELPEFERQQAVIEWLNARDLAVEQARALQALGVHKAVVNRVTEPYMWITVVLSMTEDLNFYGLRDHEMAEPHFQDLARKMKAARDASTPKVLKAGDWHLPFWGDSGGQPDDEEKLIELLQSDALYEVGARKLGVSGVPLDVRSIENWGRDLRLKVSVGRTARVSYLTHDGRRDLKEDIALHDRLVVAEPLHASPAEHVAQAMDFPNWFKDQAGDRADLDHLIKQAARLRAARGFDVRPSQAELELETCLAQMRSGNFWGFRQYRKTLPNENIGGPAL